MSDLDADQGCPVGCRFFALQALTPPMSEGPRPSSDRLSRLHPDDNNERQSIQEHVTMQASARAAGSEDPALQTKKTPTTEVVGPGLQTRPGVAGTQLPPKGGSHESGGGGSYGGTRAGESQ